MKKNILIKLEDVEKVYSSGKDLILKALKGIDLEIKEGEFVAIMGPSGSGKSTLMNILGCLDTLSHGSYTLGSEDIKEMSQDKLAIIRNEKVGFIFQSFNLLPKLRAWENVALPLAYQGVKAKERKERALLALDKVGLEDRAKHHPNELSGGQRQRVAIARALVGEPEIIMADEPTGNLDSKSEEEIIKILQDLNNDGSTIIMVTHEESVAKHCKRTIRLKDGIIIEDEMNELT